MNAGLPVESRLPLESADQFRIVHEQKRVLIETFVDARPHATDSRD